MPYFRIYSRRTESQEKIATNGTISEVSMFIVTESAKISRDGIMIQGRLVYLRLNSIVADQPQKAILLLKGSQSFMDCSSCQMQLKIKQRTAELSHSSSCDEEITEILPTGTRNTDDYRNQVYQIQTNRPLDSHRDVTKTLWYQLVIVDSKPENRNASNSIQPNQIHATRRYIVKTSAIEFPPALAAIHGLETIPYRLYQLIGVDRLLCFDIGPCRDLPQYAFKLFSKPVYNKGVITKSSLVRIANQRMLELPTFRSLHILPFRSNSHEIHARMTGLLGQKFCISYR